MSVADQILAATAAAAENPALSVWRTVGELGGWLDTPPTPRRMLLSRDGAGVLPRGKAGVLVAPGGRGKSTALTQLAISVATGRPWLGVYDVPEPGRVVLALAEEDADEIRRKLYYTVRALGLTPAEMQLVRDRVVPLGLAGEMVSLVTLDSRSGAVTGAPALKTMLDRLREHEYALAILDPLSRFGPDAESDNARATATIQCVEMMTATAGSPTVLVAHHTNKTSRSAGNASDATNIRGVTALTDGFRWQAGLDGKGEDDLAFSVTKSNYTAPTPSVPLLRGEDGVLRAMTADEVAERLQSGTSRDAVALDRVRATVLATVMANPRIGTTQLRKLVGGNAGRVDSAVAGLVREGRIADRGTDRAHRYEVPDAAE